LAAKREGKRLSGEKKGVNLNKSNPQEREGGKGKEANFLLQPPDVLFQQKYKKKRGGRDSGEKKRGEGSRPNCSRPFNFKTFRRGREKKRKKIRKGGEGGKGREEIGLFLRCGNAVFTEREGGKPCERGGKKKKGGREPGKSIPSHPPRGKERSRETIKGPFTFPTHS